MNFLVVIHLAILVLVTGENHARYKRVDDLNDLRISLSSNDQQVLNNLGREIMDVQSALSKTKNYLGVMSIFGDDPMESLNSLVERFRNILLDLFSSLNIDTSVLNNFTKIFPVKEDYTTVEDFAGTIGSAIGAASGAALGAIIGAGLDYSTIGANIKVLTDFMTEMRKLLEDILGVFDGSLTETLDPLGIGKAIGDTGNALLNPISNEILGILGVPTSTSASTSRSEDLKITTKSTTISPLIPSIVPPILPSIIPSSGDIQKVIENPVDAITSEIETGVNITSNLLTDPIKSVIGSGSSILGLSRTEGDESSEKNLKKSKSLIPSWILKK